MEHLQNTSPKSYDLVAARWWANAGWYDPVLVFLETPCLNSTKLQIVD